MILKSFMYPVDILSCYKYFRGAFTAAAGGFCPSIYIMVPVSMHSFFQKVKGGGKHHPLFLILNVELKLSSDPLILMGPEAGVVGGHLCMADITGGCAVASMFLEKLSGTASS